MMTKTNFEHYFEEIKNNLDDTNPTCYIAKNIMGDGSCPLKSCGDCELDSLKLAVQPYQEPKPKYQLTLFAKSILEHAARYNYKYMAWSIGNGLHVYVDEPRYEPLTRTWKDGGTKECITLFLDCFPFLAPKHKAYSIQEILDNCEVIEK